MKTITHESSAPYQIALDWSVPSQWQPQLRADLNELQAYRAKAPDPNELDRLRAEQAERDRQLEAGRLKCSRFLRRVVLAAITNIRAKLEESVSTNRRHAIEEHLRLKAKHYGLDVLPDGTVKLPNRKLIREVLTSQGL
jgi:hypothetical protein